MTFKLKDFNKNGVAWPFEISGITSNLENEYNKFQSKAIKTLGHPVTLKPNLLSKFFDSLIDHPSILPKVKELIGENIYVWSSAFFPKTALDGKFVSFHQDNPYQDWHTPGKIITAWIPITDTGINSGGIEYLPYSHKKKDGKRLDKFFSSKDYRFPLKKKYGKNIIKKIEIIDIKAGSIVFHHGDIWHGSGFNETKSDRIALSIHFMNGKSKFHPKIKNPKFNHYKLFDTLKMEESFFPITWSGDNKVSKFIKSYIR